MVLVAGADVGAVSALVIRHGVSVRVQGGGVSVGARQCTFEHKDDDAASRINEHSCTYYIPAKC